MHIHIGIYSCIYIYIYIYTHIPAVRGFTRHFLAMHLDRRPRVLALHAAFFDKQKAFDDANKVQGHGRLWDIVVTHSGMQLDHMVNSYK